MSKDDSYNITVNISVSLTKEEFDELDIARRYTGFRHGNKIMEIIRSKQKGRVEQPSVTHYWVSGRGIAYVGVLEPVDVMGLFNFEEDEKDVR